MLDAYAAGLFDGEGVVRIDRWEKPNSNHVRYQVVAAIGMNYQPVIAELHDTYGGYFGENRHDLRGPNNRIQFCWRVASQKAVSFLRRVHPFLIVKRDQTELALLLQDNIDKYRHKLGNQYQSHPERDAIFAERAEWAKQISELKKVSFPSLNG